jgi:hypothetical protein
MSTNAFESDQQQLDHDDDDSSFASLQLSPPSAALSATAALITTTASIPESTSASNPSTQTSLRSSVAASDDSGDPLKLNELQNSLKQLTIGSSSSEDKDKDVDDGAIDGEYLQSILLLMLSKRGGT